jgi:hypothetical protein
MCARSRAALAAAHRETMPKTTFDPAIHGFAFGNSWEFTAVEKQRLRETFAKYLTWGGVLSALTLGPVGAVLTLFGIRAIRKAIEAELSQESFGLCGGMSFAALDYFYSPLQVPRESQPPLGPPLRTYLWDRQVHSFESDLARLCAWVILLKHVPSSWPFRDVTARLLAWTEGEWETVKAQLDGGHPVPLMLVRDTPDPFENHQVLAIDYDDGETPNQVTIYLYDPNYPYDPQETGKESTIVLEFDERLRSVRESRVERPVLRGFFREAYARHDPPAVID